MEMTKKEFIKAYNENKPNAFVRWVYRNYNSSLKAKPIPWGTWFAILCFAIATIGMIYGDQTNNKELANKFVLFYLGFVTMFPITLYAFINNKNRNKKIANKLGLSVDKYNDYCKKYL